MLELLRTEDLRRYDEHTLPIVCGEHTVLLRSARPSIYHVLSFLRLGHRNAQLIYVSARIGQEQVSDFRRSHS